MPAFADAVVNHRPTPSNRVFRINVPHYSMPSATRRRSASSDDEDGTSESPEPLGPDATEQEKIPRRSNTSAE